MKILVSWYGAFNGHGTIGDLLSVQSLTNYLHNHEYEFHVTSYKYFANIPAKLVDWQKVQPDDYDIFIFVCGPIIKHHLLLPALFDRYSNCHKIGIGVSLFPDDHFNYYYPFDCVFAREGGREIFDDIAIIAPDYFRKKVVSPKKNGITIGVSLRGKQKEYGVENCLFCLTDTIVRDAAECLLTDRKGRIVYIENHIERSGLNAAEIDRQYANCDVVLSSRLHGALLALRHSVPFVAIDQIRNGAKVYNILSRMAWPYVYKVEDITVDRIASVVGELINGSKKELLLEEKQKVFLKAENVLEKLGEYLGAVRQC